MSRLILSLCIYHVYKYLSVINIHLCLWIYISSFVLPFSLFSILLTQYPITLHSFLLVHTFLHFEHLKSLFGRLHKAKCNRVRDWLPEISSSDWLRFLSFWFYLGIPHYSCCHFTQMSSHTKLYTWMGKSLNFLIFLLHGFFYLTVCACWRLFIWLKMKTK